MATTPRFRVRHDLAPNDAVAWAQVDYAFYEFMLPFELSRKPALAHTPEKLIEEDRRLSLGEIRDSATQVLLYYDLPAADWTGYFPLLRGRDRPYEGR